VKYPGEHFMNMTVAGIICIEVGVFAFGIGLLRNPTSRPWYRLRLLIGGPLAVVIGILLLTGVIGG
jgi:hypothetical protein